LQKYIEVVVKSSNYTLQQVKEPVESVEQAEEETQEPQEESDAKRHKSE